MLKTIDGILRFKASFCLKLVFGKKNSLCSSAEKSLLKRKNVSLF